MLSSVKLLWSVEELERRRSHISSALKVRSINLVLKVAKKPFYVLGMLDHYLKKKDANETSELLRITLLTSFYG